MAILETANDILIDFNGNRAYLQDDKLWVRNIADTNLTPGYIMFNESDLGEPSVDKHYNYIDIDYKGSLQVRFFLDRTLKHSYTLPTSTNRTTAWVHYPLDNRSPFQKTYLVFVTSTADTELYGFEVDFSVNKRRRIG